MRGFTQATVMGNLTRDLEVKQTNSGKSVVSFSVAVNRGEDNVSYIDCVAWNQGAETLAKYLSKGSPILVSGELSQRTWETDGAKRSKTELIVQTFVFVGGGEKTERSDRPLKQSEALSEAQEDMITGGEPIDLTEIPF